MAKPDQSNIKRCGAKPPCWRLSLELGPELLRSAPVEFVVKKLMESRELRGQKEDIYLLIAELLSNALDYGVLGLNPSLKESPDGYESYFTLRGEALEALAVGWIRIECELIPEPGKFTLIVRVEDSGPGFDQSKSLCSLSDNFTWHGRGIPLLHSLCKSLVYNEKGNDVEAVYVWRQNGCMEE